MQVILLEKVTNLGKLGDLVNVRPGFGRNFLIPRGKAVLATDDNKKKFEERRAELQKAEADALSEAQGRSDELNGKTITISAIAGEEGKLFGSVGTVDIAEAISKMGLAIQKHEVRLPAGPLRALGMHEVVLHLHPDVDATVTINIVAES